MNKHPKYKLNSVISIKDGVVDPDFGMDISGWSGKIHEVCEANDRDRVYGITLDDKTLENAGEAYYLKCEKSNLKHSEIYLAEDELQLK